MDHFYLVIALLTAGISLAFGLVNLFTGLNKEGEWVYLIFGLMGLCVAVYFLIPPTGFIMNPAPPYSINIKLKRFFLISDYALFPWFIQYYTGYRQKRLQIAISSCAVLSFIMMFFTTTSSKLPAWVLIVLATLGAMVFCGLRAGIVQIRRRDLINGRWFMFAMIIFLVVYLIGATNQIFNDRVTAFLNGKIFFPINVMQLSFMLVMGIRLSHNTIDKLRLERVVRLRDMRWQSLLENIQLIIVEMDIGGNIKYLNQFGIKTLGYSSPDELLDKDWFTHFLPPHEATFAKSVYTHSLMENEIIPYYRSSVITKDGLRRSVTWSNVFVYDDKGKLIGALSIGSDITDQQKAFAQVKELKEELEKENFRLRGELLPAHLQEEIIGNSEAIRYALQKVQQVASTTAIVLLEGETGVGKELFANLIQRLGDRINAPFVKVNCGALPAELIESELFGHERGAFTGAVQLRKGRFELADSGTIFLDEISELPLSLQPKLLRVLQDGTFERIGGQQTIKVDVRVISATNRDLGQEVEHGNFRRDLYYRLNVFPITIPPLRNRKEDILLLVNYFVERTGKKHSKKIDNISKANMNRLIEYPWPGNVRELKNVIERSIISSSNGTLGLEWFNRALLQNNTLHNGSTSLEQMEKEHILKVLEDCRWKINGENGAAEKLNLHPNTLRSKMKKLNISRPSA